MWVSCRAGDASGGDIANRNGVFDYKAVAKGKPGPLVARYYEVVRVPSSWYLEQIDSLA